MSDRGGLYALLAGDYEDLFPVAPSTIERLRAAGARGGARVLDLGCATGGHVRALRAAPDPPETYGVDLSPEMIGVAQRQDPNHADTYAAMDIRDVADHPAAPFALVACLGNTIAHLASHDAVGGFLTAARAALTPGGSLQLQFIDASHLAPGETLELPPLESSRVRVERRYRRVDETAIRFESRVERIGGKHAEVVTPLLVLETDRICALLEQRGFTIATVVPDGRSRLVGAGWNHQTTDRQRAARTHTPQEES